MTCCGCKKTGCTTKQCKCVAAGIPCTAICTCCNCMNAAKVILNFFVITALYKFKLLQELVKNLSLFNDLDLFTMKFENPLSQFLQVTDSVLTKIWDAVLSNMQISWCWRKEDLIEITYNINHYFFICQLPDMHAINFKWAPSFSTLMSLFTYILLYLYC